MLNRIKGVLLQEIYITRHSLEVFMDIFFFPSMTAIVFGFISKYLSGDNWLAAKYLIMGMLLWQIIQITQYSMSVGALWNIWSRNLSNMFIAPLSISEYIIAQMISGVIKASLVFTSLSIFSFIALVLIFLRSGGLICFFISLIFFFLHGLWG